MSDPLSLYSRPAFIRAAVFVHSVYTDKKFKKTLTLRTICAMIIVEMRQELRCSAVN